MEQIQPPGYEIRVRGILGDRLLTAFPDLVASRMAATPCSGRLPDQSALHGVLGHIESLGLELVEIRRR